MKAFGLCLAVLLCCSGCFSVSIYSRGAAPDVPDDHSPGAQFAEGWEVNAWPLFYSSPRAGGRKTSVLWPILRINTSSEKRQFALWPLFERRVSPGHKVLSLPLFKRIHGPNAPSLTKFTGVVDENAGTTMTMLFPLFFRETANKPARGAAKPAIKAWGLAPLYGRASARQDTGMREVTYILPPLIRMVSAPGGGEFQVWPLFIRKNYEEYDSVNILGPVYSWYSGLEEAHASILWPLYREEARLGQPLKRTYLGLFSVYEDALYY